MSSSGPRVDMALLLAANQVGVRLEIVGGRPTWEAHPVMKHQEAVHRIQTSIEKNESASVNGCECLHLADVYICFPDGSLKRPDISIFCRRPDEEETAILLVPEAVIEVISKGYEIKDLEIAPHFYLMQGVKDVVVFDPYTEMIWHFRRNETIRHVSPMMIELECGCQCIV